MEVLRETIGGEAGPETPFSAVTDTDPVKIDNLTNIQGDRFCEPTEVYWPIPGNDD